MNSRITPCCYAAALAAAVWALCSPASAVVVISDGFGDADRNNDGSITADDVNVAGSVNDFYWGPGRIPDAPLLGDFNDDTIVDAGDYTVWRDNLGAVDDTVLNENGDGIPGVTAADYNVWKNNFGATGGNRKVTEALDAADVGIRWHSLRGFTGASGNLPGTGSAKPTLRIVDDSQGAQLETQPITEPGGLGRTAIDSGYALSWESKGSGAVGAGFFGQTISLGENVDDEVKVSFDFRLWGDTPNAEELSPDYSELRFGLFEDTDNQLGLTNPFAGRQVDENGDPTTALQPAVWGQDDGLFNGRLTDQAGTTDDDIGAKGDAGWTGAVWIGDNVPAGSTDITFENGGGARIREETNTGEILQGGDVEFVGRPENLNPDVLGKPEYDFIDMEPGKVYNIAMSLKRATELVEGDSILATIIVFDYEANAEFSFSALENDPQSDEWDYFVLRNATSGANEIDFLMDNFMVEVNPAVAAISSTPEPTAAGLLCLGGAIVSTVLRRRK